MRQTIDPELPRQTRSMRGILGQFQSLGDNCEFGLLQRSEGWEPRDLLRLGAIWIPENVRLRATIKALDDGFSGLGDPESVRLEPDGAQPPREFIVRETRWNLFLHTGAAEGSIEPELLRLRQIDGLQRRRHKLVEDMTSARQVFIWKSNVATSEADIRDLVACIRRYGPNLLLWVNVADQAHPDGSVEYAGDGLLTGYVSKFAPYETADDSDIPSWHAMCRNAAAMADDLRLQGEWSHRATVSALASGA
jgi:hypothetical protein